MVPVSKQKSCFESANPACDIGALGEPATLSGDRCRGAGPSSVRKKVEGFPGVGGNWQCWEDVCYERSGIVGSQREDTGTFHLERWPRMSRV